MANISIDLSQFKASGVYTIEYDATQSIVINTQTTRLVVGFSKKGPMNAPVYCPDVKTARQIFGDIDRDLENKGSFFHRSLFTCLEVGPCFALALVPFNDDVTSTNADYDTYKSYSLSTTEANGSTASALYSSYFNKERFYFPDSNYFLGNVNSASSPNEGKLFNFVNIGQTPFSVIVRKSGDITGFNITARDWFNSLNQPIPPFVREFDYISDYFVNVDVISGDWTDYQRLSTDPIFSTYFDSRGIIKSNYTAFLNSPYVTTLATFQGCIIPDLTDTNNINYSIDTIINSNIATTGLFCALDRNALANYDITDITSAGRVDMIGHSIIQNQPDTVNFLSYNFAAKEYFDYTQQSSHSSTNNTYQYDLGPSATSNKPAGLGSTGASYSPAANGYSLNDPNKVAYFESYYGAGNNGKFNNILVLRKEAFSTAQYTVLSNLHAGASIALQGATGATQYAIISSVNEVTVGSDYVLKLGISHPLKQTEGTTTGKNAVVVDCDNSSTITISGTGPAAEINPGDWILADNGSGVRYYFRTTSLGATGGNTVITVDTTNTIFGGATNITYIDTHFTVYWESSAGTAGSLFDVINLNSLINSLTVVAEPDKFTYTSVGGGAQDYYTAYEYSPLYEAFVNGILTDTDTVYVAGPTPLYVNASFGTDVDAVPTMTLTAYLDASLTIGYTGSWTFSTIKDSSGATVSPTALRVYGLAGDYAQSIGATGFNSTKTTCYIGAGDGSSIQVGQYIVADPLNTGDAGQYILTRVVSKRLISSGTYSGYYQINTNQRMVNYSGSIVRYKSVDQAATNYQPTYLPGFKMTSYHLPNGSDTQLARILGMLDPANTNLPAALSSRHIILFRYIIDTFDGGLQPMSYPKNLLTKLAKSRQKCLAIINTPSIAKFKASTDPRFTDSPTNTNPLPLLNTSYIAAGGNLSLGPSYEYTLPDEANGSKFAGFFSPFLMIRENNKNFAIPPAADVSNNFIRKFVTGQPYAIVAGPRRGVLSNPKLVGLEYDFTDTDRGYLEPMGWNPIVYRRGIGFTIFGNQSGYQNVPSAFNNLHVRDLLITIEETIEDILAHFLFEFNDASTRLQIKTIVDAYLDTVRSAGGIYAFTTVMDSKNNTPDIIDQNFAIIDVGIEPARGAQKFINRITVFKSGGLSSGGFASV